MQADQTPTLTPIAFAQNGLRNAIPENSRTGSVPGAASLNDGFPPATMLPPTQGGVPPAGRDMNGVLFLLAQTVRWAQAGGSFVYDAGFADDPNVGGYPRGAVLLRADLSGFWFSLADNNTTNPDATDANDPNAARNWIPLNADWNAVSGPGLILNRPDLAAVATSGDYNDLANQPAGFVPAGSLLAYAGASVPDSFLLANGAAVSRSAYAALFAAIGTIYGAGNGATTFNLPDTRGIYLRGLDNGRGLDPGRTLGSYQADSFGSHVHGVNDPQHAHGVADPSHMHGVNDPQHVHGWSDGSAQVYAYSGGGAGLTNGNTVNRGTTMLPAATGISIAASAPVSAFMAARPVSRFRHRVVPRRAAGTSP
ncbi:microcystin-dependent protein [Paraburkholderia sp. GAS448]|uniref:phage tail protein n=1 Tax=Paraburkholderia sp. GAS448 TaxID=3035136 RepID=UPI003D1A8FF2